MTKIKQIQSDLFYIRSKVLNLRTFKEETVKELCLDAAFAAIRSAEIALSAADSSEEK